MAAQVAANGPNVDNHSVSDPRDQTGSTPAPDGGFVGHARLVFVLTLGSRILGLVRDAICSRVFGTAAVFSAFVTAFTIPNLFRRLFGEGALTAAFIPAYAQLDERDPALAARFASLTVLVTAAGLSALVVVGELCLWALLPETGSPDRWVFTYAMIMLPYMPLVCLVAILGGVLQSHGSFAPHAAAPIVLNVAMISGVSVSALIAGLELWAVGIWMSVAVVAAGFVQLAWCLWRLRPHVRWGLTFIGCRESMRVMVSRMVPALIGLGTLQLSTFLDSLIAGWPVISGAEGGARVPWTMIAYPLDEAAAAVLFYAQRLYQFPLGVFGIAIATAVFPYLARTADRPDSFGATLRRGVRLSLFIGVPASVGLILVRGELASVLYGGGEFGDASLVRVTAVLAAYAPAVWAYSLTHVLTRAFYAMGDTSLPMRVGMVTVGLNLVLNLCLIWVLEEVGLAVATAIGAIFQAGVLGWFASRRIVSEHGVFDGAVIRSAGATVMLSGVMGGAVLLARLGWSSLLPEDGSWLLVLIRLLVLVGVGGVAYLGGSVLLKRAEVGWLFERAGDPSRQ